MSNPYPVEVSPGEIPRVKRLLARLHPVPYLVDGEHFLRPTTVFLAYCKRHKICYLDYIHGYSRYLMCPRCLAEWKIKYGD